MAIKLPDPGNGIPEQKTGNDEWTNMQIVRENFADQSNAASRLVGEEAGNLLEVGSFGIGGKARILGKIEVDSASKNPRLVGGNYWADDIIGAFFSISSQYGDLFIGGSTYRKSTPQYVYCSQSSPLKQSDIHTFWTTQNATKDSNGFLKGASPVVDLYDDNIELNRDAKEQGNISFEKLGTGNYLVKGSLGFAQKGWCIEMPKDANGNVLVAVVDEQLKNNDISIKTYAKRFDEETGDVVANLAKPRDIPAGRCINLRLHEAKEEIDEPVI